MLERSAESDVFLEVVAARRHRDPVVTVRRSFRENNRRGSVAVSPKVPGYLRDEQQGLLTGIKNQKA